MIGGLLTCFYLAELNACILRGIVQHFAEELIRHKVRAGTGRKIAASGQQLHSFCVYGFIAVDRAVQSAAALGERRGIENNVIILAFLPLLHLGQ